MVYRDRFMNFVGWVNPYSGRFLSNDNDSAPTADYLGLTRPQILKIGMCMSHCIGFIITAIGLTDGLQKCKSAFPEIELPIKINATQDLINKIDDRKHLRHNCEEEVKKVNFYSTIGYHVCLSILYLMKGTSCLSTLGSLPSRILSYFRGSNREGVGLQNPSRSDIGMQNLTPVFNRSVPETIHQLRDNPTNIQTGERPAVTISTSPQVEFLSREPQQDGTGSVLNPNADVFRDNPQNGGGRAITGFNLRNPTASPSFVQVSQIRSPRVVNV
jgi:hypothetical protein